MKSLWHKLVLVLLCTLPLAGCGGGGAPGSTNSLDTGVVLASATMVPADGTKDTPDIDVAIHACTPTTVEEGLFRATAKLQVAAERLNTNIDYDPFPATIEACTLTYLKANEDTAGPVIEQMTIFPNCEIRSGDTECVITIMDLQRKVDWWKMVINGANLPAEYPTHYIIRAQCTYITRYGKTGTFESKTDVWLADWDTC